VILYLKDYGVLRNMKIWVKRIPPIQNSSQNGKMQVLFNNKSDGTFGNYFGVQEQKNEPRILKFDILRVPSTQILTKKAFCYKKMSL
jgi:hypothetical protein